VKEDFSTLGFACAGEMIPVKPFRLDTPGAGFQFSVPTLGSWRRYEAVPPLAGRVHPALKKRYVRLQTALACILRIPGDADQRSEVMAIAIPN
jgi:hypothetical protein